MMHENKEKPKRAIVAAVQLPNVSDVELDASLTELRQLAKTLGYEMVGRFTQKRARFDTTAYFGVGKRQEMRRFVRNEFDPGHGQDSDRANDDSADDSAQAPADAASRSADIILVDHEISPMQARNLEKEIGCDVMDRTMVILEIFHRHARSRAAIAHVEIVRLSFMAPRLREAAKAAGPQGRQRSGVRGRGGGESLGEIDRRKVRDRIAELQKELDAIDIERRTHRARRQERQGLAPVALVGYTNAGKSTLMRALTGSEVLVADKLFATLDTTVRALHPESVPRVLVSDTVGFIKNLPHGLVASFKSTLDEALEASLLLHVVDASDAGFERQLAVTEKVLNEIGASGVPRLLVFNKIDQIGDANNQADREAELQLRHPRCIAISARRAADIQKLGEAIIAFFQAGLVEDDIFLPWSAQKLRGEIFSSCTVLNEQADGEGALLRIRGEPETVKRLRERFSR
ncbi:MAG: GTPase HflX [Betaproteobacteria bacterium]|nr:GTPase HflX [Betaproteobacteria bacterium]